MVNPWSRITAYFRSGPGTLPSDRQRDLALATSVLVLAYAAIVVTGFGIALDRLPPGPGSWRAIPIYAFCGYLLLVLTWTAQARTLRQTEETQATPAAVPTTADERERAGQRESLYRRARLAYLAFITMFGLFYAGAVLFFKVPNELTRYPQIYIAINATALVIFLYDFLNRLILGREANVARLAGQRRFFPQYLEYVPVFVQYAADLGGLAAFCVFAWGTLTFLDNIGYVAVGVPWLHMSMIRTLQDLDLVIAVAAGAVALFLLALLGLLFAAGRNRDAPRIFFSTFGRMVWFGLDEGLLSLRFVVGPLVSLVPAFAIAYFSAGVTAYFTRAAVAPGNGLGDLLNPFSQSSLGNMVTGFADLALGILAVAAVVLAVAIVEHSTALVRRSLLLLGTAGRAVAFSLLILFLSLALTNAVVILTVTRAPRPFQVGAAALIALAATLGFTAYRSVLQSIRGQVFGDGRDDDLIVTAGQHRVINSATRLLEGAARGQVELCVRSTNDFRAGQEALIIQSQGTNAGAYEFGTVLRVEESALVLATKLIHTYHVDEHSSAQVVKVPNFRKVIVEGGGQITAQPWSRSLGIGGIVTFRASSILHVKDGGEIDANYLGFKGGDPHVHASNEAHKDASQTPVTTESFGFNGESYLDAPSRSPYPNGGGGGGGRGDSDQGGSGASYRTLGSVGGGRPFSESQVGVEYGDTHLNRIFLGSGGGSPGDQNIRGGNGGGIIIVYARRLIVAGTICCNGENGQAGDGRPGGGGGSGGSIMLVGASVDVGDYHVTAEGGAGGLSGHAYTPPIQEPTDSKGVGDPSRLPVVSVPPVIHASLRTIGGTGGHGGIYVGYSQELRGTTKPPATEELVDISQHAGRMAGMRREF